MPDYAGRIDTPVNQGEFGRAIAREEGRGERYTGAAVSDWMNNKSEPTLGAVGAIAILSGRAKEWVGWGTGPEWAEAPLVLQTAANYPTTAIPDPELDGSLATAETERGRKQSARRRKAK